MNQGLERLGATGDRSGGAGKPEPGIEGSAAPTRDSFFLLAVLLALLLGVWSLRGAGTGSPVDTDAARHAMNGVFIHDLLLSGKITDPIHYGKQFYAHLPALSLPFHPPLFPGVESIFFFVLGVNLIAARLAVAIAVALAALMLYKLVRASNLPPSVAMASMITVVTWSWSQRVARDVMLEFPALAFALASLYCLRDLEKEYSLRRGLAFALLAGAAVWTKQQTVFLGIVPFGYILLTGRWRMLLGKTLWISSFVFACCVAALAALSLPFGGAGVDQASKPAEATSIFWRNLKYYAHVLPDDLGPVQGGLLILAVVLLIAGYKHRILTGRTSLYVSWAAASFVILLLIGPYTSRYLFFVFPPLVVLGYAALGSLAALWVQPRWAWAFPISAAVLSFYLNTWEPVPFLQGPDEAAQLLAGTPAKRILYCGGTDGNFIFSIRTRRAMKDIIVIPGEKMPASKFGEEAFMEFARSYGINYVVFERAAKVAGVRPWSKLMEAPPPALSPVLNIPLASSDHRWNGELRVFQVSNPSPTPLNELDLGVNLLGKGKIQLAF